VGSVLVDAKPDDEVTVGGDPPAVDIVFELAAELRAMRQSVYWI
jgi:hypothetical protein